MSVSEAPTISFQFQDHGWSLPMLTPTYNYYNYNGV